MKTDLLFQFAGYLARQRSVPPSGDIGPWVELASDFLKKAEEAGLYITRAKQSDCSDDCICKE